MAFTVLAPWQLGKNTATQQRNEQLREAFETDPVPAEEVFGPDGAVPEGSEWRRVTLTGRYLPDQQVLLRNRPVDAKPAIQVLTAFRADDGVTYLVDRGWEPPVDEGLPEIAAPPKGPVTVAGFARLNEIAPERAPIIEPDATQVYGISTEQVGDLVDADLATDWVQLAKDQPGGLLPIPLPQLESGPYLSYGIQWIFFGIAAPLIVVWFVFAELRERKREQAEQAEHEQQLRQARTRVAAQRAPESVRADGGAADAATTHPAPAPERAAEHSATDRAEEERARRLAQRYGDSGHGQALKRGRRQGDRFDD
nr:SURF1 family cytochrome oxidase biogenesis protein [Corynebacterium sp. TAE3-ERU12]